MVTRMSFLGGFAIVISVMALLFGGCEETSVESRHPRLIVEPASWTDTSYQGGSAPNRWFKVRGADIDSFEYDLKSSQADWLEAAYSKVRKAPDSFFVKVIASGLAPGTHLGSIELKGTDQPNLQGTVNVTIVKNPVLNVSSSALQYDAVAGGAAPAAQQIILTSDIPSGEVSYTLEHGTGWLDLSKNSGTTPDTVVVSADNSGLTHGHYYDTIVVRSNEVAVTRQEVLCCLSVFSWTEQQRAVSDLRGVYFHDRNIGWAVGLIASAEDFTGYIIGTTDGGETWQLQTGLSGDSALRSIDFADASAGWAVGRHGWVLHTDNGGADWERQQTPVETDLWGVDFADNATGWAVGVAGTIIRTVNSGKDWEEQFSAASRDLSGVCFINRTHGWVVGNNGIILRTTNGGQEWGSYGSSGLTADLRGVFFLDANTGWVVGEGGTILHTTDGGLSWTPHESGTESWLNAVLFVDNSQGWVVGRDGNILYTGDAGVTWETQFGGVTEWLYDVSFVDDQYGWIVGAAGLILHTVAGGI